jgi:hypothetical protein
MPVMCWMVGKSESHGGYMRHKLTGYFLIKGIGLVAHHATKPMPLIKKYPVNLCLIYPPWDSDLPTIHQFDSARKIQTFRMFLIDAKTGKAIHRYQIHMIDPNVI